MAFTPISNTVPQYEENGVAASGYFIKFYESGTTTPTAMATDSTGTTLLDKCELNTEGYPINGSSAVFIPHINKKYKIALFRNAADADANDLASAAWPAVDGLFPVVTVKTTYVEGVDSVADLAGFAGTKDDQQISLKGWHPDSDVGGGILYWDAAKPKSDHNGGTVFSPTVPFSATTDDYLDGAGETNTGGSGCWVRVFGAIKLEDFGAKSGGDVTNAASIILSEFMYLYSKDSDAVYNMDSLSITNSVYIDMNGAILNHINGAASEMISLSGATTKGIFKNTRFTGQNIDRINRQGFVRSTPSITIDGAVFDNCTFSDCSARAIDIVGTGTVEVRGCEFNEIEGYPIRVNGLENLSVTASNIIYSATNPNVTDGDFIRAIQPTACKSVIVQGCYLNSGRRYRDGIWSSGCDNIAISGNVIKEHFDDSITFVGVCNKASVTGNVLSGSDVTGGVVTVAGSEVRDLVITGNSFSDGVRGCYLFGAGRVMLSGNDFNDYQYGLVFPVAAPSEQVIIANNIYENIQDNYIDFGATSNVDVIGNSFGTLTGIASVGLIGLTSTKINVRNNKFYNLANRAIQTGSLDWDVSNNTFISIPERAISVGDSAGTVNLGVNGNNFIDCDAPLAVVGGKGTTGLTIGNNRATSATDQKASGAPAYSLGDATHVVVSGNYIKDFGRGAANAAGSNYIVYTSNDDSLCGFDAASGLASAIISSIANNLK